MTTSRNNSVQERINKNKVIEFTFNKKKYTGLQGDTLASAMLANNIQFVARSFKYHRKRGLLSFGTEEPNALVELKQDEYQEPNLAMTKIDIYEGLIAKSQNYRGSLKFDFMAINQLLTPFLVVGFYYKTFMWPKSFWEKIYEPFIRKSAGLGSASKNPDPNKYSHQNHHCDILIVGGGVSGICSALLLASTNKKIVLCEEQNKLGGYTLFQNKNTTINNQTFDLWLKEQIAKIQTHKNITIKKNTQVFARYDNNIFAAIEKTSLDLTNQNNHLPKEKLWIIHTEKVILATGNIEKPCLFGNNDMPRIMLSSAFQAFYNYWGINFNGTIGIITNNDFAYQVAQDLIQNKQTKIFIIDSRNNLSTKAKELKNQNIEIILNSVAIQAKGFIKLKQLKVMNVLTKKYSLHKVDYIAMSNGFSPNINIASQMGADIKFKEQNDCFEVTSLNQNYICIGSCLSNKKIDDLAKHYILNIKKILPDIEINHSFQVKLSENAKLNLNLENNQKTIDLTQYTKKPIFLDFQNDVTLKDIKIALKEGMQSIEHLKRYTTLGMATDQGKTSNTNAIKEIAKILNKPVDQIGITKYRAPNSPVSIGVLAGEHVAKNFQPYRKTAIHRWHKEHGAIFIETGQWLRPRYYKTTKNESLMQACIKEARQVRKSVGICDVSTLGKIEIFGEDAANFLDKIYINNWQKLPIHKVRYGLMLREDGMAMDDGTTTKLANNHFLMTTTTVNAAIVLAHLEFHAQTVYKHMDVHFCSATEQWASMAIAGPKSRCVLQKVFKNYDLSNHSLPYMGMLEMYINKIKIRIFRISFSGELGYELNVPWIYAESIWVAIYLAGLEYQITPYGTEALSILRIEKGHPAGNELDGRTTALDLNMEKMKSKTKDFIGKTLSLREELTQSHRSKLVGIMPINKKNKLRAGAHLVLASQVNSKKLNAYDSLGWLSSVHYSPQFECWIALGFINQTDYLKNLDTVSYYPLKNEIIPIKIVNPVFFDPRSERLYA